MSPSGAILAVTDLKKHFNVGSMLFGGRKTVKAVDGVSFSLARGEMLGLVGESGSGKSTVGRTILRLSTPTAGRIVFDGQDITGLGRSDLRPIRRMMQMVFQDPFSSLNPRMTVEELLTAPLRIHGLAAEPGARPRRVAELLELVGLSPSHGSRFPHEFSGGQRQRIGIARALAVEPEFLVADEPVSALDVSIQAQVIKLLLEIRRRLGLSILFISHDLAVVGYVCDRIAVMYLGRIVELADAAQLFARPQHPYTRALLDSVLTPEPGLGIPDTRLGAAAPDPVDPPAGCGFHPRCPVAVERCRMEAPRLARLDDGQVACHLAAPAPVPA